MGSLAGTRAQERAPRTRLGGIVTFRGQTYTTTGELMQAMAGAVEDAGAVYSVRLTAKGEQLADRLQREGGGR